VFGNALGWVGRCRDLGGISLPVSMLKSFDFKTNTEVVQHPGFDTDL